jgi:hypothetical protein
MKVANPMTTDSNGEIRPLFSLEEIEAWENPK